MTLPRCQFIKVAVAVPCLVASLFLCRNETWSQAVRTIKVVVAAPPGGGSDILARLLAEQIMRAQVVTMMIENRPGASTAIGTEAAARAAPDGNTLLINTPPFVINPLLRKLSYDPLTSFEPLCNLVQTPVLIVVNAVSPYRTLGDLLSAALIKPGDLTMAGAGPATSLHIAFEMLKRAANVNMTFVPYPGDAPAVNALLGGHVTAAFAPYSGMMEQLKAGKLRALATASRKRDESLPDVPTVVESGYDDITVDFWQGVVAPAKTPKETVSQLTAWFTSALQVPELKAKLIPLGLYPVVVCGAEFAAQIRQQYDAFGRMIRDANIKAQ